HDRELNDLAELFVRPTDEAHTFLKPLSDETVDHIASLLVAKFGEVENRRSLWTPELVTWYIDELADVQSWKSLEICNKLGKRYLHDTHREGRCRSWGNLFHLLNGHL